MDRNEIDGRTARMNGATLRPYHDGGTIPAGTKAPDMTGECFVSAGKATRFRIPVIEPGTKPVVTDVSLSDQCCAIADQVVPEYRSGNYSCSGVYAKRWQAAYDAAMLVLCNNEEMN